MQRFFTSIVLSLLPLSALAGEPILVPDFTPGSTAEFSLAFMLQEKVVEELKKDGNIILTTAAARPVVGSQLDTCFDVDWCPYAPLQQLPARVAITVRVSRDSGRDNSLFGNVEFYEQGDPTPMDSYEQLIVPGQEAAFAFDLRTKTQDLMSLLGSAPAEDLMQAVKLLDAANRPAQPAPDDRPPPDVRPPPDLPPDKPPPDVTPDKPPATDLDRDWQNDPLSVLLEGTDIQERHVAGAEGNLRKLEMDPRDWMYKAMPHSGRVIVEVRGGWALGDVDRRADVRVDVNDGGEPQAEWFQEGPVESSRPRGGLLIGYAPLASLDLGVLVGMQYGTKGLTTGWTQNGTGGQSSALDEVAAVQFFIQPRLRAYLAPTGVAKPYVTAFAESRIFDSYDIESPVAIQYPEPPGGFVTGAGGGGGIVFDPGPIVGFFVEGTYTKHFGIRAEAAQQGLPPAVAPEAPVAAGSTIGAVGGVQFRL